MPIPISHLFLGKENEIHKEPRKKDIIEMSKGWPSIDIEISEIPHLDYPEDQTARPGGQPDFGEPVLPDL